MAQTRAFKILHKLPVMALMTPDELLSPMVLTELAENVEQYTLLVPLIHYVRQNRAKMKWSRNHASYAPFF